MLKYCSHYIWQWATNSAKENDCSHLWERSSILIQHIRIAFQVSVHQKSLFYHPLVHSGFTLQDCAHLNHLCVFHFNIQYVCACVQVHLTQRSSCTVLDYEVLNHIKLTKIRTTSIRFELWQIAKPRISVCTCVRVAMLYIAFLILLHCWHSTCQNLLRVNTTMYRQTYQEYLLTTVVSHRAAPVHETSRVGWFTPVGGCSFVCCFHYPSPLLLLSTKANTHNHRTREWVGFAGTF